MTRDVIQGPTGDFFVPSGPPETRRICEGLSRLLWEGGEYEHPELPTNIATVLDIGGGWGAFAVWARKRFGADIELNCYEPHDVGCEFIRANDPKASVYEVAVTSQPTARLLVGEDWGGSSTHFNCGDGKPVAVIHPSALPACDFLKIDAEGVEAEVLIAYPIHETKAVAYEWHTPDLRSECANICASNGMRCLVDRDGPWGPGNGVAIWVPA